MPHRHFGMRHLFFLRDYFMFIDMGFLGYF